MTDADTSASASWLDKLTTERLSQRSNVNIAETEDRVRVEQVINAAVDGSLAKAFKQESGYRKILEYNLLRRELFDVKKTGKVINRQKVDVPPMKTIMSVIDEELHNVGQMDPSGKVMQPQSALVIIHWVLTKAHADALQDWLGAWSQDTTLYKNLGTVIVMTVNESLFIEPLRRLSYSAVIPTGTKEEIRGKLQSIADRAKALKLKVTDSLVQNALGLNLHQTETAALKGIFTTPNQQFTTVPFGEMKVTVMESMGLHYITPTIDYSDIGSYDYLKKEMQDFVVAPLLDPGKVQRYGLGFPKGAVLVGPPGTGKTLFALATAKAVGIPMIKLEATDLYKSLVGESESQVRKITDVFKAMQPIVVFIDEADAVFRKREDVMSTDSGVQRRIFNGLIDALGQPDRGWFVIMATNRVQDMDEAATRPGRCDEIIYVPYPDCEGREAIFRVQCTKLHKFPVDPKLNYNGLAVRAAFMSGAEIEKWCTLAARQAMRENSPLITTDHFLSVEVQVAIDKQKRAENTRKDMEELRKIPNVNRPLMEQSVQKLMEEIQQLGTTGEERTDILSRSFPASA